MSAEIDQLARLLIKPTADLVHHRGVVVSVDAVEKTCTVTYAGATVTNIPYEASLTIATDDAVDLLIVGVAARVIGVIQ